MLEPEKAHATSEFVVMAWSGGRALLCLASSLAIVVRQADEILCGFLTFFSMQYPVICVCFLVLMEFEVTADALRLFHKSNVHHVSYFYGGFYWHCFGWCLSL